MKLTSQNKATLTVKYDGTNVIISDGINTHTEAVTSRNFTLDTFFGNGVADNLDGTLYHAKVWSGGDRNTGTLVCNLVAHENDDSTKENAIDLQGNFEFTKYVDSGGSITYVDNLQRMYKGKLENRKADMLNGKLSVINDTTLMDTDYPPLISDTDAGYATGKVANRVYGSHSCKYGKNATDGTSLQKNNLIKGTYAKVTDTGYRWIVGGNGSDITIAPTGALWIWHDEYKRFMQISTSYTTGVDTQGNKYVEISPQSGYFVQAYDYIMPTNVSRAGTPNWNSPDNAINDNFDINDSDAYSEVIVPEPGGANATLTLIYSDVPTYATQSKVVAYGVDDSGVDIFTLTGHGTTTDIQGVGGYATAPITSADGSLPSSLVFTVEDDGTATEWARVSNCFMRLELRVIEKKDIYISTTNPLDTQREIIEDICNDIGLSYEDNTDVDAVTLAVNIDTQKKAIEHIKSLAIEGACVPFVNSSNELKLLKVDLSASVDKEIQVADIAKLTTDETSLQQVVNEMEIGYKFDNFTNGTTEIKSGSNSDSISIYNETMSKSIVSKYYQAEPTTLLNYYVNGTADTLFSQVRNTFEITTKDILGVLPYDTSGNFKPLIRLEMGDVISVNPDMDKLQKCNGESWDGKKFIIYGLETGIRYMKFKGLEL